MEGGDTGGYSHGVLKSMTNDECRSSFHFVFVCGRSLSSVGASFPYMGSRFRMWVVVFVRGWLSCGGGGGSLLWPVSVFHCHVAVSNVAPGFPVSKESGGRGCLHTCWWSLRLVTWPLDVVGEGVVLGARRRWCRWWVVCCRPAVVVAWPSSVVIVVVVSHRCRWSWLLMWRSCIVRMVYRRVQVVVGGGRWWAVVVVVEEEGGCCLLTCLLMPKSSIGKCQCSIWVVGHGTQNILKSFYYLLMVAWCRC